MAIGSKAILLAIGVNVVVAATATAELIPSPDGLTVYDTRLHVTWLADANLARTAAGRLTVPGSTLTFQAAGLVGPDGGMSFETAKIWVTALNTLADETGHIVGYLGHTNWSLPTSPWSLPDAPILAPPNPAIAYDPSCTRLGPNLASFQWNCRNSALGSLYYDAFNLRFPNTAVPVARDALGPFYNLQPYLYWSGTSGGGGANTFSLSTGWEGANTHEHYMYVLPLFPGRLPCTVVELPSGVIVRHCPTYTPAGIGDLEVSEGTVYDPRLGVSWLADGNLALTQNFGAQCDPADNPDATNRRCIDRDGSMTLTVAKNWITGMNDAAWLGVTSWALPLVDTTDLCGEPQQGHGPGNLPNFNCVASPMGALFYTQLGLTKGQSVFTGRGRVGPFERMEPYLYWSCTAQRPPGDPTACDYSQSPDANALKFAYSFSFGNGFQGTDVVENSLYVMVYYPETPAQALADAIDAALGSHLLVGEFQSGASAIAEAQTARARQQARSAFVALVEAHRGAPLTKAQARQLIALARAV